MPDWPEREPEWFSKDGLCTWPAVSTVIAFVDAEEYYADLRREVEATRRGDYIYWIGFEGGLDVPMPKSASRPARRPYPPRPSQPSDVSWFDLLESADNRGVELRVLLNLNPSPKKPGNRYKTNFEVVARLNTLKHCAAINDFRYLWLNGTHHQKLVIVHNENLGLIAYCGTTDIEESRIINRWCEVQCKVTGPAASDLCEIFRKRFREHSEILQRIGSGNAFLPTHVKTYATKTANCFVQVATTYGNPNRRNPLLFVRPLTGTVVPPTQPLNEPHRLEYRSDSILPFLGLLSSSPTLYLGNNFFVEIDPAAPPLLHEARRQSNTYSFARSGNTGIYHLIKQALAHTGQFIYMEDQYLVCDRPMGTYKSMLDLLVEKVRQENFRKLIILCTRIDQIQEEFQFTGWRHRQNFISQLTSAAPGKVVVCQYKPSAPFYVHSKTWIFDDSYLITGSANCNRRGYSHDSELDIGIWDWNHKLVKDLRVRLWQRRLNTEGVQTTIPPDQLDDFLAAAKFWEQPQNFGLEIENSLQSNLAPVTFPDLGDDAAAVKRRAQLGCAVSGGGFGTPPADITPLVELIIKELKVEGLWELAVDPDGT